MQLGQEKNRVVAVEKPEFRADILKQWERKQQAYIPVWVNQQDNYYRGKGAIPRVMSESARGCGV